MALISVTHIASTGQTFTAIPEGESFTNWDSLKVVLTEQAAPDLGSYAGTLDDSLGMVWLVFLGSAVPARWDDAVAAFNLHTVAAILTTFKADADYGTADGGLVANAAQVAASATEVRLAELERLAAIQAKSDSIGTVKSQTRW